MAHGIVQSATLSKKIKIVTIASLRTSEWPAENSSATADTNTTESVNEISPVSYFVLVGVMCLGVLCAMLLLVHPSKVTKSNGEKVHIEPAKPFQEEIADTFSLLTNAKMWLLSLLFVQSNWYYTFEFNAINGSLFQPASRGLNSAMYWSMQMLGSIVTGAIILDRDWGSIRNSAVFGLAFVGVVNIVQWSLTAYYQFANGYARGNFPESLFSITTGGSDYWVPAALFAFMGFADACVQTYAYWIIGSLSDSTNITSQYFGYYKAVQSLGAAVAWGIEFGGVSYDVQMVICTVLAVVCLPPAYVVALRLTDLPAVPTAAGDIVRFPIDDTHNGLQHVFLDTLED
ncbi:hypothetical protein SARC_01897 [Sphaeroforma arctica JP610]|uniref:Uncharacterized protein n=1 Tax=Sphaeroforma arctica JP610 TaxID=667725 RepID=A0A0L0GAM6_9EUKA|nr:hypothetical protein SARC_01897 [Sphaeroforma arctica JP610]KNC85951.1 hypothetical protein SARC_01897 [Sphaeroforma arctica JP610]|eukprot:XP_014159853.1 hypothetical protein SARC_01897 [Sphaeroforma arctica JP610]